MTEEPADIPLLVSIGVSGHRDLGDSDSVQRVRRFVQEQFSILSQRLAAYGRPIEYLLLSPLAEGADRIFVEAVWAVAPEARLFVPLPFAKADYERSFSTEQSVEEFNAYLRHPNCLEWKELPAGIPGEYFHVGKYVVENCDVMFFLHDGSDVSASALDGGTASVIRYAEQRARCPIAYPGDLSRLSSCHAPFRSRSHLISVYIDLSLLQSYAASYGSGRVSLGAVDLDGFFSEICHYRTGELRLALQDVRGRSGFRESVEGFSQAHFDLPAARYQKRFDAHSTLVIWVAFLISALVVLERGTGGNHIFDPLGAFGKVLNWDSLVAAGMVAIVWLVHFVNRQDYLARWIEHRYMAERMRQLNLFLDAGVPFSVILVQGGNDPAGRRVKKLWQSIYFHSLLRFRSLGLEPLPPEELRQELLSPSGLLHGQLQWHLQRAVEKRRTYARQKAVRFMLFSLSLTVAVVSAAVVAAGLETDELANQFNVLWGLLAAALASYAAYTQLKEHSRLAARYEITCEQLARLETDVRFAVLADPAREMEELQGLAIDTSEILMKTTYDWLDAMREKNPAWA